MASESWLVQLGPHGGRQLVDQLARRRAALGLDASIAETIRSSLRYVLALPDEDILALDQRVREAAG